MSNHVAGNAYIWLCQQYIVMSAASGGERTFSLEVFLSDDGCGFSGKIKQE